MGKNVVCVWVSLEVCKNQRSLANRFELVQFTKGVAGSNATRSELKRESRGFFFFFFLVGYVEERLWWPIQCPNIGGKKKASS